MAEMIIEQVGPGLFRSEIPLPRNPLKATNSYFIKGEERNLIIDTGMNQEECKTAMLHALDKLNIELEITDIFITHLHADHIGLVDILMKENSTVFFNRPDTEILKTKNIWQLVCFLSGRHGFPVNEIEKAIAEHPGQRYIPQNTLNFTLIDEGDVINYGDYELHCISTPGHTRGHTCLYEPRLKWLFSGDHILGDITPNISTWRVDDNPLGHYFKNLDKVAKMSIELVLPGHRSLLTDCRKRIEELKEHHFQRLEEVLAIMENENSCSAYDVASRISWDLLIDSWDQFPLMQKWFASGEALAHILYLEAEGKVKREMNGEVIVFTTA